MKQGKRPTKEQKIFIASHGLNPDHWLISKNTSSEMLIIHRTSDQTRILEK